MEQGGEQREHGVERAKRYALMLTVELKGKERAAHFKGKARSVLKSCEALAQAGHQNRQLKYLQPSSLDSVCPVGGLFTYTRLHHRPLLALEGAPTYEGYVQQLHDQEAPGPATPEQSAGRARRESLDLRAVERSRASAPLLAGPPITRSSPRAYRSPRELLSAIPNADGHHPRESPTTEAVPGDDSLLAVVGRTSSKLYELGGALSGDLATERELALLESRLSSLHTKGRWKNADSPAPSASSHSSTMSSPLPALNARSSGNFTPGSPSSHLPSISSSPISYMRHSSSLLPSNLCIGTHH